MFVLYDKEFEFKTYLKRHQMICLNTCKKCRKRIEADGSHNVKASCKCL